jgi:hypothetical protein
MLHLRRVQDAVSSPRTEELMDALELSGGLLKSIRDYAV